MAWAKVDDGWWCHPKVLGLTLPARGLWVSALSWSCHQRNPVVPESFLSLVGAADEPLELVAAGLWTECDDGGWEIHDWSEYQERTVSEKRAEAGRKGGQARGKAKQTQAKAKQTPSTEPVASEPNGQAGTHPFPSLPDPNTTTSPQDNLQPDEQTIRRTAALVGKAIAGERGDAYASGITKRILTDPILGADDRSTIVAALTEGQDPETIAAGWVERDPLAGALYPSADRAVPERHGPKLDEFQGWDRYDETHKPDFAALRSTLHTGGEAS